MPALKNKRKKYVLKGNIIYNLVSPRKYLLDNLKEIYKITDDDVHDILKRRRNGEVDNLDVQITGKCNLKCAHCYLGKKEFKDIPFRVLRQVFDESKALGIYNVIITGGEPTLHSQFEEIIKYLNNERFRITVVTNGTIPEKIIKVSEMIYEVVVSLDGFKNDYEKIRNYNYEKVIQSIKKFKNKGINLRINAILHSNLLEYYKEFMNYINKEIGAPVTFLPVGNLGFARKNKWLFGNQLKLGEVLRNIGCFENKTRCNFFYRHIAISYKGFIYPCQFFREIDQYRMGSIFERKGLKKIFEEIRNSNMIPKISNTKCDSCKFLKKCGGGCRGRALAYENNPFEPDPLWCDIFLGRKTNKEFFPEIRNPLYEVFDYGSYPKSEVIYNIFKEIIISLKPNKILEIGCGLGDFSVELSKLLPHALICGIDISQRMINIAKQKEKNNLSFERRTIKEVNEKYDVALAVYSFFNHFKSKKEIKSFFNALKKKTRYFLFDSNDYFLFPETSKIKESFGDVLFEEFVRRNKSYVFSFRKYTWKNKEYYFSMSWPIIEWKTFLKKWGKIEKIIKLNKRNIYLVNFQ